MKRPGVDIMPCVNISNCRIRDLCVICSKCRKLTVFCSTVYSSGSICAGGKLIFEGTCCFFDDAGRVLYFAPTPKNDDSTLLSISLLQSGMNTGSIVAVFDGEIHVSLRGEMIYQVNVQQAVKGRPPALSIAFTPCALTMQVWCAQDVDGVEKLKNVASAFTAMIDQGEEGGTDEEGRGGGKRKRPRQGEEEESTKDATGKRRRGGGAESVAKESESKGDASLDSLLSRCDGFGSS